MRLRRFCAATKDLSPLLALSLEECDSPLFGSRPSHSSLTTSHSLLSPSPPPFTRPRKAKSLRAIIYVFTCPVSPCPPPFTKTGGRGVGDFSSLEFQISNQASEAFHVF